MKLWTPHETIEIKVRWDIVLCITYKHYRTGKETSASNDIGKGVLTQIKRDEFGQGI